MSAPPLVSVLVRARNDETLIGRTLAGVFGQKTDFPFEVVVCDDASTDRTREVAGRFPVRFFERPAGEYRPGDTPEAVCEAAAGCRAVLSSRLHLLILAANVGTPVFGIARGSKLANWLANFGRTVEGSVRNCDWDETAAHVLAAIRDPGDWEEVRAAAYARLLARFDGARDEFSRKVRDLSR